MGWIQQVLEEHSESESPQRFYYWSAMSAISACVRRNICLERYHYKLYPNIYVFVVARSGLRKGPPIALAQKLMNKVQCTKVIEGRASIQAVIRDLGKA